MKNPRISLWLKSSVESFNIQSQVAELLNRDFPQGEISVHERLEDFHNSLSPGGIALTWYFEPKWFEVGLSHIFTPAAGHDWVPEDPKGRTPVSYGTFHGPLMAESLMAMVLYHQRQMAQLVENQSRRIYDRNVQSESKSLMGQKVQIWGYGQIGFHCAKVLQAFGCEVSGVCRSPSVKPEIEGVRLLTPLEAKSTLWEQDIIVSLIPASGEVVMDTEFFHSLKNGVQFYSLGRGEGIDEKALLNVLNTGLVSVAGLDVFTQEPLPQESELWAHPRVILSPHSACVMQDYGRLFYEEIRRQLSELLVD